MSTFNDAQVLLRRKLLINKMSEACLEYQIVYSKHSAVLQVMTMKDAMKKLICIKKLNEIAEKQLRVFTQERQDESIELYRQINEIDVPSKKFKSLIKKLDAAREGMCKLMPKIQHLEDSMPDSQVVTNFSVKHADATGSCASSV